MSTALAVSTPGFMSPAHWQMMTQQAEALVKSGFLPVAIKTPQQAIAIMMVGQELGILPWQALSTINVIQGKPTISPQLMLALIQRSGQLEDITIDGKESGCTVTMKRKGQTAHTETFSIADAGKLGLAGKDNYKKQPGTMLKWRAIAACARVVFSDVILGLYTPEEMGADVTVTETGEQVIIEKPTIPFEIVKPAPEPEAEQGEIVEEAPVKGEPWTETEAKTWVHAQMAKGHSDVELRTALVINKKFSEWDGSVEDADKALAAYVKAQMDAAEQDNARLTGKLAAAPRSIDDTDLDKIFADADKSAAPSGEEA